MHRGGRLGGKRQRDVPPASVVFDPLAGARNRGRIRRLVSVGVYTTCLHVTRDNNTMRAVSDRIKKKKKKQKAEEQNEERRRNKRVSYVSPPGVTGRLTRADSAARRSRPSSPPADGRQMRYHSSYACRSHEPHGRLTPVTKVPLCRRRQHTCCFTFPAGRKTYGKPGRDRTERDWNS